MNLNKFKFQKLKVALIKSSLPSYFPEKYNVWDRCSNCLKLLCDKADADLFIIDKIPMNGEETSEIIKQCEEDRIDFIILLHGGFSMGDVARTIAASSFKVGFWSIPEPIRTGDIQLNNFVSLNMSMSIARQVRDLKRFPVKWFHDAPENNKLHERILITLNSLKVAKLLSKSRIGVIGGLAMTFYNMEISTNELKSRLGTEVFNHDINELTDLMSSQSEVLVKEELSLITKIAKIDGVSHNQMILTARAALALRQIANDNNYNALAVSDWPALQNISNMHPGAAFSWLEENDHIPVASEGDVLGAISQLIAKSITGKVGYLLDMTEPDLESGRLLMWHGGGGPLYLANKDGARWVNHPMIGRGTKKGPIYGAISDLVFKEGPVTIFRVSRNAGSLFQMTANIVNQNPSGFTGCRGWLNEFNILDETVSLNDLVSTVMLHGLEHHFILVPDNITSILAEFGAWTGMNSMSKKPMQSHLTDLDFI